MFASAKSITQVVLSLALLPLAAHAASIKRAATTCNGHSELCDRSYGNITFVGAHDSYAVSSTSLAANQDYNVTQQLKDGIRMLQMQTHNQSGTIQLCHTSCDLFNGGTLENYLQSVKSWMDNNTDDVVSLLIVNSYDNFPPSAYDTVFKSVGLDTLAYSPPSANLTESEWPTLGSMINNGTRLVVFLTTQADYEAIPYLIDEFTNIWETAYDVTTTTFNCDVNRTNGNPNEQMYLINHFLDSSIAGILYPDKSAASQTNGVNGTGSLGQQVATCASEYDRNPNFMLVDFYEYGNGSVFEVAATANGVTYSPTSPIATPITGSGGSSSSSGAWGGYQITGAHFAAMMAMSMGMLLGALTVV
ncbi:PLC-like phosphodiesterase [Wolfiporia cocos MD-104 SS10]|uniref:PLC-like phosphodiesterase n=1 Tax=Wolfiporia cocos (strain MD-104) TaxID=742152 RepID=A0A2H3J5I3_WOLCO|nr:PLC-like phosphodiesterase [Wolfiporia cocos MD-104 SS10]